MLKYFKNKLVKDLLKGRDAKVVDRQHVYLDDYEIRNRLVITTTFCLEHSIVYHTEDTEKGHKYHSFYIDYKFNLDGYDKVTEQEVSKILSDLQFEKIDERGWFRYKPLTEEVDQQIEIKCLIKEESFEDMLGYLIVIFSPSSFFCKDFTIVERIKLILKTFDNSLEKLFVDPR